MCWIQDNTCHGCRCETVTCRSEGLAAYRKQGGKAMVAITRRSDGPCGGGEVILPNHCMHALSVIYHTCNVWDCLVAEPFLRHARREVMQWHPGPLICVYLDKALHSQWNQEEPFNTNISDTSHNTNWRRYVGSAEMTDNNLQKWCLCRWPQLSIGDHVATRRWPLDQPLGQLSVIIIAITLLIVPTTAYIPNGIMYGRANQATLSGAFAKTEPSQMTKSRAHELSDVHGVRDLRPMRPILFWVLPHLVPVRLVSPAMEVFWALEFSNLMEKVLIFATWKQVSQCFPPACGVWQPIACQARLSENTLLLQPAGNDLDSSMCLKWDYATHHHTLAERPKETLDNFHSDDHQNTNTRF